MYDRKIETREFVGESEEEAVAKAVQFFGVEREALEIHSGAGLGIFGLGGREVIVARPAGPRPRGGRAERADEGRERGEGRGGRGRGRGRSERGEGRERGRGGRESRGHAAAAEGETEQEEDRRPLPSKGQAEGELGPTGEFLLGTVERMGLGDFTLSETREGELVIYKLSGPAALELGAGDARGVDALQLLANQAEVRHHEEPARVVVEAEGDSERREESLTRLAERAARRARDSGRAVALDPMNGRDRRIVHVALRDSDGLATMSVGSGRYRQVVVVPEGAPEYEEARQVSEAASGGDAD